MSKLTINKIFVKRLNDALTSAEVPNSLPARAAYLQRLTGMSIQACRKWLGAKSLPEYETMLVISSALGVLVSYLIGEISTRTYTSNDSKFQVSTTGESELITIEINENLFNETLKSGDTVICSRTKQIEENGGIYLLQSAQRRYFCILSRENDRLSVTSHNNGEEKTVIYEDETIIELFLDSLCGKVKAVIRPLAQFN